MVNSHHIVGTGGHKVLVLPGWFGDAASWSGLWPHLDAARFSYAFMDYRGYGGSIDAVGEYTMDEIAADALALADELGWRDFSLIGHSMGGKAAQRVLVEAPDRIRKLVGISPVPASEVPFDDDGWVLFSSAPDQPDSRRAIIDLTTGNRLTDTWLDAMSEYSLRTSNRDAFAAYLHAWAKTDFHERVQGHPVPVLVVVGEHDSALGADTMRQTWLQWYPNAELVVMSNAGHYAMNETPVALASVIERFLLD